jgi:hypothetical protein
VNGGGSLALEASLVSGNRSGDGAFAASGIGGAGGPGGSGATAGAGGNGSGGSGGGGGRGGGITGSGNSQTLTNVTVTANSTGSGGDGGSGSGGSGSTAGTAFGGAGGPGGSGGGVLGSGGAMTLVQATIAQNGLGGGGAGGSPGGAGGLGGAGSAVGQTSGTTTVQNVILNGDCTGTITDGGRNLDFPASTCPGSNGDPKLGALKDNGGPTKTLALGAGSAALDSVPPGGAGCPASDQRGVARPVGPACDAGAYEVAPPVATTGAATRVHSTSASAEGTVNARGLGTTYRVEFGKTTAYGKTSAVLSTSAQTAVAVTLGLAGLDPSTTHHYRLVASNVDGTSVGADRTFKTPKAPVLDQLKVKPATLAIAKAATPKTDVIKAAKVRRGTTISFRLSEDARVTLTFQRKQKGLKLRRRGKRSCVKPTRKNKRAVLKQLKGKPLRRARCTRYVSRGSLRRDAHEGADKLAFSGRIGRKALSRGSYRLVAVARVGSRGNPSKKRSARLKIVSAKKTTKKSR